MAITLSPLAPGTFPSLPAIAGVEIATAHSGIRYKGRPDVLLASFAPATTVAGVLTQSLVRAAPVDWCRSVIKKGKARALLVNAGNANAFTGKTGMASVTRTTKAVAHALKCSADHICVASTGVIGEPLKDKKITTLLPELKTSLSAKGWDNAARAIMTTDTFPKLVTRTTHIGHVPVTINGIAKGSGMIAPDMATLLAFVFTDAALPASVLSRLLSATNAQSFNAITVDGDTSTNDTLLAFATGKAPHAKITTASDIKLKHFKVALLEVLTELAILVVKDGEGAQKFVTITVRGAVHAKAAHKVAMTIANSPLVKTAIAGEDANWGRIVAAAGRAGVPLIQEKLEVRIGGIVVARNGARVAGFDETPVAQHMKGQHITIDLKMGSGKGMATVYSCDLTHGYIDINGSYRS